MLSTILALPTLLLTLHTTTLILPTISRLRQYESASKTAAQYSNTAAEKLRKTQLTQASGVIATTISLISCLYLLSSPSIQYQGVTAGVNAVICGLAYVHMAGFWNEREQTRIPLVKDFNEAIRGSEKVVLLLGTLGVGWGVAAGLWVVGMGEGVVGLVIWGVAVGARAWGIAGEMGWKR
ncbi:hypothetical protein COCMIDRAFT_29865 [Bipolaris oryzae ATCC 44560]|uniref:Uncharacterized protein n=1 Tax=Bipolaris oryzae ATCC 44560 TaxID=930090 RepID=W6Z0Y1_COCMI|nr:uncharacterized protein COCMIDRAFT_29865 [Bipolaris oryzae ATCC 44560]EUC41324.1 hypothetical protein COCMIDRAFT_29865 [Bipolaris oryzae ATCC 44560]